MERASLYERLARNAAVGAIEERENTATSASKQYVWGVRLGHRDELILRDRDTNGNGNLDERLYCLMDYYNPSSVVNPSGVVQERYGFTAFGLRSIMNTDWAEQSSSAHDFDFEFHGQFVDDESGYNDYGFRYYSPVIGCWINRDPIQEEGGVNLYVFVGNSPLNGNDRFGHSVVWVNKPTKHITATTGSPRSFTDNNFGQADAEWQLPEDEVECECIETAAGKVWVISSIKVEFWGIQYLRESSSYPYRGVKEEDARTVEHQHIDDFYKWANERGKEHSNKWFAVYSKVEHSDEPTCEKEAKLNLNRNLGRSFRLAKKASNRHWDDSGRHTAGSSNFLQGSGPELPANPALKRY